MVRIPTVRRIQACGAMIRARGRAPLGTSCTKPRLGCRHRDELDTGRNTMPTFKLDTRSPIQAPGEAGEVALGVLRADVMTGADKRRLDVAERGVHPLKRHPLGGLRPGAGDHREVIAASRRDRRPTRQAVGDDVAAGGEVALGELLDLLLAEALDHRQPQPARLALGRGLHCGDERRLAGGTPAALAARARAAEIGVVDLDPTCELGLAGVALRHRRHQLVLDQPGGRLPRAEPARQLHRRHPAFALGQG